MDTQNSSNTKVINRHKEFPPNAVYVGRPTVWGNPIKLKKGGDRKEVIIKYYEYLLENPELIQRAKKELKGKTLACWCAPKTCHAHVLAALVDDKPWDAYLPQEKQLSLFDLGL